jgi:quinol-cytochrome oxidoreductase complex cytochrome b subunit/cytochrome c2
MSDTATGKRSITPRQGKGLLRRIYAWFDHRTGLDKLLHQALDAPIPGGARWSYVFGSGLLFILLSQIITGVFLALYYLPSADRAHTTIAYITKEVASGAFLRSLHAYGSSAMVIVLIVHLTQTFLWGAYKNRRELLWLSGCALFVLVLGMAFTGYLLPWDQKAYFATSVGTNIASEIPLIGDWLKRLIRGGSDMGTLTLSRFFVAHVFLIPGAIFALIALHVYLFRKAGAAGSVRSDLRLPGPATQSFYPRQLLMDLGFAVALIAALGILAHFRPVELGPEANPADTRYVPRPEWYYLPIFQWMKYWPGSLAFLGIVVIPSSIAVLFAGLPFIDRRRERRPWRRPVAVGGFAIILLSAFSLGALSWFSDRRDRAIAAQLAHQRQETRRFMQAPFEPEMAEASLAAANVALVDPFAAKGKDVYELQSCDSCHGDSGRGSAEGPKLVGIGAKFQPDQLEALLRHPTRKMIDGGMNAVVVNDQEMKSLIAYINSVK